MALAWPSPERYALMLAAYRAFGSGAIEAPGQHGAPLVAEQIVAGKRIGFFEHRYEREGFGVVGGRDHRGFRLGDLGLQVLSAGAVGTYNGKAARGPLRAPNSL